MDTKSKVIPIPVLDNVEKFTIEADIKRNNSRVGLGIANAKNYGYIFGVDNSSMAAWKYTNASWSNLGDTSATITEWVHLKLTINGLNVTVSLTNTNGNTYTKNVTMDSRYSTRSVGIGVASQYSNRTGYIKNIKAESL